MRLPTRIALANTRNWCAACWLLFVIGGCSHAIAGARPAASATAAPDSLVGTVAVVGTTPSQQFVLRSGSEVTQLHATPADSTALVHLSGVEIVAHGRASGGQFLVSSVMARRVEGQLVVDGILRKGDGQMFVETETGRLPLSNPPHAFWSMIGARFWIGGPLATGPNAYGVISPAP